MRTKCVLFFFAAFFFIAADAQVNANDSLALVDLYNRTNGPNWEEHDNWLTKKPLSTWFGIYLANGRVSEIILPVNRLKGELPASIGAFDSLIELNLYGNTLRGNIPVPIGNLTQLRILYLGYNKLSGTIPAAIEKLSLLTTLDLDWNGLTGVIPDSLVKCRNLTSIDLSVNLLTGTIPASFKKLAQLKTLRLSANRLGPTLKDVFADSAPLTDLELYSCGFRGPIPLFLNRFTNLFSLDLSGNRFSGTIPAGFSKLRQLSRLYLGGNLLTGSIPPLNPDINILDLDRNRLKYDDNPQYTGRRTTIGEAELGYNQFTFSGLEYFVERYDNVRYLPQAQINVHRYGNGLAVSAGGTLSRNTYTWYQVGSGPVARTTGDSTFQPLQSGRYCVHVSNTVVTQLILTSDTIAYTAPSVKNEPALSLSPNPAKGFLVIHGLNEKKEASITVADMNGYVWQKTVSHQQSEIRMDVSRLKAGTYVVNVNEGTTVKTVPFIKE